MNFKNILYLTSDDFEQYLFNYKFTSISQQNQIINALKFGYKKVLNRKYSKVDFQRPLIENKLPKVIETIIICLTGEQTSIIIIF